MPAKAVSLPQSTPCQAQTMGTGLLKFKALDPCFQLLSRCPKMTYVVTESCIRCKYTDCVDVCPVDCFREGPNFLVIDPDECIDCNLCVPECPVDAIFAEDDVPEDQQHFIALNAKLSKKLPTITTKKPGLPDAAQWEKVKDKLKTLSAEELE